ncbi:adenosylcobinamide-phosphate synthase CbiB [Chengkuizengella axinellae]|uniref:Cobalamin biosynthesis protein CobD n=1 Tax=Chengkuizengella axinellae TaxID=3064388 RepID=A0ABT9J0R5_9BACL|nr:adenosylcobinamide-phosphate synthase CbiB [Chengkuizengella sp. 2205SS18-9]MDP5275211.1 adenosylcobinamide-phosphate synthase CbiB [Chengkuizengella sp. 2205SS18-9]
MLFYSIEEILWILAAAMIVDWVIGDPERLPHPVILMGKAIQLIEKRSYKQNKRRGIGLLICVLFLSFSITLIITVGLHYIHPWLGYIANVWLISTTIAMKGLKEAALLVYAPLQQADLSEARKYVGYIVGRDTTNLSESEITRATVETVSENIVDAVISPLFYALFGAAPLAMLYRATNTLDSMVGYKNDKYQHYGWASARFDDVLNWIPARLTGLLIVIVSFLHKKLDSERSWKSIRTFAHHHPSPNSGIPESAVAGALGIQLGGVNVYGGIISERARMGVALRKLECDDILHSIQILYGVSLLCVGGILCGLLFIYL